MLIVGKLLSQSAELTTVVATRSGVRLVFIAKLVERAYEARDYKHAALYAYIDA